MFDPTIYENLKVVIEGELYDRDFDGEIAIINREDIVNLATMSRSYLVTFTLKNNSHLFTATLELNATASDLYHEILETNQLKGCKLVLFLQGPIKNIAKTPAIIEDLLAEKWNNRPTIEQQVYFDWKKNKLDKYYLKIQLTFNRNINEDHIFDFPEIITLLIDSLKIFEKIEINP
ncbi:hypothetical protein RJD24_20355 [Bacillaceae bacterium IKA-2]|nr:hypothetical protein RJD24_20355 [Bacillaceae bacterium IKA-2]